MPTRTPIDHAGLMAVAIALVDDDGFDALTLSNVAARLGVGPSALYSHVAGLAGLHHAAAVESTRRLTVNVRDAAVGRSGPEALRSVAAAYRGYAQLHPGRFTATLRVVEADPLMDDAQRELDGVFVLLGEAGGLSTAKAGRAARNVRRAIHGFVVVEHSNGPSEHADREYGELLEVLSAMLVP